MQEISCKYEYMDTPPREREPVFYALIFIFKGFMTPEILRFYIKNEKNLFWK